MALEDRKKPGRDVKAHSGRISRDELSEKGGTITMGKGHWVRKELLRPRTGRDSIHTPKRLELEGSWQWPHTHCQRFEPQHHPRI
jgi:hypothetical protein